MKFDEYSNTSEVLLRMSKQGQGNKPEGKSTKHGGSHHKGGHPHGGRSGGASTADGQPRDVRLRQSNGQRLVKLRLGDKDKIIAAKESLKAKWSSAEYGELSLILDETPAVLPEPIIMQVPKSLTDAAKAKRAELAEAVEREDDLENLLTVAEGKPNPSPAEQARIRELSKQLKTLQSSRSDVEYDLKRCKGMVDRYEAEAMKLALSTSHKQAPKCIAMISDIRGMCDPTLLEQLESHTAYDAAYSKRDPAEVWNVLTAVILAGLENNPRKAYTDAERHFIRKFAARGPTRPTGGT